MQIVISDQTIPHDCSHQKCGKLGVREDLSSVLLAQAQPGQGVIAMAQEDGNALCRGLRRVSQVC